MKSLIFSGPVLTASGYGEHARQILRALVRSNLYDISVESLKWGFTPFISSSEEELSLFKDLVKKFEQERKTGKKYDVSVQVTIPNEFRKLARINVGVTAGIEVDRVSPKWIQAANDNVDLVVVPSLHSARTFSEITYKNESGQELRLNKPVIVAPEGFDSTLFNLSREGVEDKFNFPSEFNFLSVGLGFDKAFGEDRKNISGLVKDFCEAFKDDERVGLVLKVSLVNNSLLDFETVKNRISQVKQAAGCKEFPRIHLLHGRMTRKELSELYKNPKIKAFVTTTHGEGFGLPILEAAACGLPVLATNWSGHMDFLHNAEGKKRFIPFDYDLKEVPQSAVWDGVIEKGTRWAYVKSDDVKTKLKKFFLSPDKPTEWARELAASIAPLDEKNISSSFVNELSSWLQAQAIAAPTKDDHRTLKQRIIGDLQIEPGKKTLLYTMPMSAGDVFISTAVVDSLRKKFPEHYIVFATDLKYTDILKGNPDIDAIISWQSWMADVPFCENVFDEVYTPNLAVQLNTSNWVHGGKGRLLGNEFAAQCGVEFGDYKITPDPVQGLPEKFIAFHPGSGRGQHEARRYKHWRAVIHNIKKNLPGYQVVTIGQEGDIHFEGCVDLRGKTTYNQLAYVIDKASCLVGIDSVSMHLAAAFRTALVAIFGSSYSTSTGPVLKHEGHNVFLLETPNRMGCEKACYKHTCVVDRDSPCVNEIDPKKIVSSVVDLVMGPQAAKESITNFVDVRPKIAGYTHVFNPESQGFPYIESIRSMLGFCDQVVVVDGGSTDGSLEKIKAIGDDRVKVFERKWDWSEPGMDGMQKAFGRAMCDIGPDDFLWQQDADEVVHEDDYEKIKKIARDFPQDMQLLHLPVIDLWGDGKTVRTDRHSWKWRMSRNNFRITHGINRNARVVDEKTGRTFAKKGMSDGCEYIDVMTGDFIPHSGFYNQQLELVRVNNPVSYGATMNDIFEKLPSVYHYSWANLPRKIRNFKEFWNKCWSNLYNDPNPVDRFPDVHSESDVIKKADELRLQGGEHGKAVTFSLRRSSPAIMEDWLRRKDSDHRRVHDDNEQTRSSQEDAGISSEQHGQEPIQIHSNP